MHACEMRGIHRIYGSENLKERDHLEDLGEDGKIILKRILNRMRICGLDSTGLEQGSSGGLLRTW
jgi:hypothetical protein